MNTLNGTDSHPSPQIMEEFPTTYSSIRIPNLLAAVDPCPVCQFSTSTGYTSVYSSDGGFVSAKEQYEESVFVASETSVSYPEDITFQHSEFSFLNAISETANPSHTIKDYTWVPEQTTTTCERQAGATDLGHADVTMGESMGTWTRPSWSTPELSVTPTGIKQQEEEKKEEEEGEDEEKDGTEQSAVLVEAPKLKKSVAAFWVVFAWLWFT